MSNKARDLRHPLDQVLRKVYPVEGFCDGHVDIEIKITKRTGFELFNTSPYHNYETWSDGYYVTATDENGKQFQCQAEDLDEALRLLAEAVEG